MKKRFLKNLVTYSALSLSLLFGCNDSSYEVDKRSIADASIDSPKRSIKSYSPSTYENNRDSGPQVNLWEEDEVVDAGVVDSQVIRDFEAPLESCIEEDEGVTVCNKEDAQGDCIDVRRCVEGYLIACHPLSIVGEVCNGIDDDCDLLIDEYQNPDDPQPSYSPFFPNATRMTSVLPNSS